MVLSPSGHRRGESGLWVQNIASPVFHRAQSYAHSHQTFETPEGSWYQGNGETTDERFLRITPVTVSRSFRKQTRSIVHDLCERVFASSVSGQPALHRRRKRLAA